MTLFYPFFVLKLRDFGDRDFGDFGDRDSGDFLNEAGTRICCAEQRKSAAATEGKKVKLRRDRSSA